MRDRNMSMVKFNIEETTTTYLSVTVPEESLLGEMQKFVRYISKHSFEALLKYRYGHLCVYGEQATQALLGHSRVCDTCPFFNMHDNPRWTCGLYYWAIRSLGSQEVKDRLFDEVMGDAFLKSLEFIEIFK
jgi:hypothetical protein